MAQETIFPSAGHHDLDPGAVYHGYKEADLMKAFRNKVILYLNQKGYKVIPDKDHETNSQYQGRIKPGAASVVVDFHANASANQKASGVEAFIANKATANSKEMAKQLCEVTATILGITNRGVKTPEQSARGTIGILNKQGTVCLMEMFFISNKSDLDKFLCGMDQLAKEYAKIIGKFEDLM
nr:N-acetylmuramoyl-L-alanine amidase [uncultured Flavobacterium sp.]